MKLLLLCMFSVLFNLGWRRWYGGGFVNTWLGNVRGVQCAVYLFITALIAYVLHPMDVWWYNLIFAVLFSAYTYCQFWARGHGACFDIGRGQADERTIKRYNERWYHIPCDFILKDHKYGFLYDFIYMGLRYTMPLVGLYLVAKIVSLFGLPLLIKPEIILIGASISPIYAFNWTLSEREQWLFEKHWSISGATNLSEYVAGAIWGLWVLCI